jgi:hypothetical protein
VDQIFGLPVSILKTMEINGKMSLDVMMNQNTENHGKTGQVRMADMTIYLTVLIMDQIVNVKLKKKT